MKKQPRAVCRTAPLSVNQIEILKFCKSPIQRSNAVNVLRSLRLWRQFKLNPSNTEMLASQAELSIRATENAIDFLVIANVLCLRRRDGGVFVERVKQAQKEAA